MSDFDSALFRDTTKGAGDTSATLIARRTGLNRGHVSRLLRGKTEPTTATVRKIADAYKQKLDDYYASAEAK
jgi:transcriptional regulator with XRE-family HTH domain